MRKRALKILVLLAIIVLYDRGMAIYFDKKYRENYGIHSNGHLNYFLQYKKTDSLFIGSSRMENHIDASVFGPDAYNLSKPGMHIAYQAAVVDLLAQHNRLPTAILVLHIETDDILLERQEAIAEDIHSLRYYYGANTFITTEINKQSHFEFLKYWSEMYRHSGNGLALITGTEKRPKATQGYFPLNGSVASTPAPPLEITSPKLYSEDFFYFLDHIQQICTTNKVEFICISAPRFEAPNFRQDCAAFISEKLKTRGIRYLNYTNDTRLPFQKRELWSDWAHFNEKGAKVFTLSVKDALTPAESIK